MLSRAPDFGRRCQNWRVVLTAHVAEWELGSMSVRRALYWDAPEPVQGDVRLVRVVRRNTVDAPPSLSTWSEAPGPS
jgi:hypothetical protein